MNKFNKYLYTFIFSVLSLLVFVLKMNECPSVYLNTDNVVASFFGEIYYSLEGFDIIYVTLFVFILYFYSNVYFVDIKNYKNKIFSIITSIIFSIIVVLGKSYDMKNSLSILYSSPGQVFKTIIYLFGYYLIFYAILKKIFSISISKIKVKKKDL